MNVFEWLDKHRYKKRGKLLNQLIPVAVCLILYVVFVGVSTWLIRGVINPVSKEKILFEIKPFDVLVGFFLYFVTAVDYALIVGRMQTANPGSKSRLVMNVATCVGCFVGVSLVLLLWGLVKEVPWLTVLLLVFAGSVMIKLGYEGKDYYEKAKEIPVFLRQVTIKLFEYLYRVAHLVVFWMPELGSPKVERMSLKKLGLWSFLLPFIIGTDDLVGYMGAMTIYNVFSLLVGIYLADILIDILIFVSPKFTKKMVENPFLSLVAAYAFLYLGVRSFWEVGQIIISSI